MRITIVSAHVVRGGAERYMALLLDGLGPEVVQEVVFLGHGEFVPDVRARGLPVTLIPTSKRLLGILRSALRLRRIVRRNGPDVVHADGIKAALVCSLALLGLRVPMVWIKHDFSWDGLLTRLVARRARLVLAVSAAAAEGAGGAGRANVRVVHNALPPLDYDAAAGRARLLELVEAREPALVLGLVGRFDPRKGHREVLAVAPALARRFPTLRIAFVGPVDPAHADDVAAVQAEAAGAGLGGIVRFLGYVENVFDLMAGCDVLTIPSIPDENGVGREGFPYVALEAMAVGTPVVAYAAGGLPESLADCGRLVPLGDRAALEREIAGLLEDAELRRRLGECGQRRIAERFALEPWLEEVRSRYREAAGAQAPA